MKGFSEEIQQDLSLSLWSEKQAYNLLVPSQPYIFHPWDTCFTTAAFYHFQGGVKINCFQNFATPVHCTACNIFQNSEKLKCQA